LGWSRADDGRASRPARTGLITVALSDQNEHTSATEATINQLSASTALGVLGLKGSGVGDTQDRASSSTERATRSGVAAGEHLHLETAAALPDHPASGPVAITYFAPAQDVPKLRVALAELVASRRPPLAVQVQPLPEVPGLADEGER
jgi:hypothetical protein